MSGVKRNIKAEIAAIVVGTVVGVIALTPHLPGLFGLIDDRPQVTVDDRITEEYVEQARRAALRHWDAPHLTELGTEELLDELRYRHEPVYRMAAAQLLGATQEGEEVAGALMIAAGTDRSPMVRAAAARSLGQLGMPQTVDFLQVVLEGDPNAEVRAEAEKAILSVRTHGVLRKVPGLDR